MDVHKNVKHYISKQYIQYRTLIINERKQHLKYMVAVLYANTPD